MAAGGEQRAAPLLQFCVPAKLPIPRTDAVVVVDLAVVQVPEQPLVNEPLGDEKLAGEAAFKADAAPHPMLLGGRHDVAHLLWRVCHRLLQNDVLARGGSGHRLIAMAAGEAGDIDAIDPRIGQHLFQLRIGPDLAPVLGAERRARERPRRADRHHPPLTGGIDGRDMGRRRPAISHDADVVFFHVRSTAPRVWSARWRTNPSMASYSGRPSRS